MEMEMKKSKEKLLKYIKIILIFITIISLNNMVSKADDTTGDTVIDKEKWEEWQKEDYWEWHTRTTTDDRAYNGNHIVIQNNVIDFYGYWQNSYKDFLYKEYKNPGKKIFKFVIDEKAANYHTLDGAGFIFNASKTDKELSGYILLFRQKDVCVYRLNNVNIATFETAPNATVATYGQLVKSVPKTNSAIHNLSVEITPTKINILEGETELLSIDLDYSIHVGESFGLISSYVQHACSILSKIEFSQIEIILEDYEVSILNTNMENTPIPGGYFELKNEAGEIVKEGKTDKNAEFNVTGITPGIYTIKQKTAPEGYILNDTIYKFEVTKDGLIVDTDTGEEIKLVIKNEKIKIPVEEEPDKDNKNEIVDKKNEIVNKNNTIIKEKDNTISSIPIPNAGNRVFIIGIAIVIIVGLSIYLIIKLKKYKIVK